MHKSSWGIVFGIVVMSCAVAGAHQTAGAGAASIDGAIQAQPAADRDKADKEQAQKPPEKKDAAAPAIKPYDKVITADFTSRPGVFTIHRLKEKLYYEIPAGALGKDFLWVSQIAKTTLGVGYGGQAAGNRVVRWERSGDRILLRSVSYDVVADPKLPVARAVEAANYHPIIMAFNIEALGKGDAPVIEVSKLFTTEVPELSAKGRIRARTFDGARSFVERAVSFPENIEVEATHTFAVPAEPPPATPPPAGQPAPPRPGSYSVLMHFSMVKLPEQPMAPRVFDERVGYFNVDQMDYGQDEQRAPERRYITRYRLEKKDPGAALSEPVKPIVYWIDPATPAKWAPFIKKGVEDWQPAFEAAGFKNAIIAKMAPTPQEDPDWSPEDARYSVIRWLPSTIENASGPHIHDPRTGEILEADIQFYHNVMNLVRDWYFVQAGPLDPRTRTLPLPDDLMGRLIEYVAAHEVGHTLGFQHNMKASATYPFEKIRDREWLRTMGHTPTLMDYSRFNYVVQPEDHIDPADLIPGIGPYDKFATMWGYKPIPEAKTPADEKKTLDEWAREQDASPWLRFSTANARGSDPGDQTEAVGDADAVQATTLGLKNLERVVQMVLPATSAKPGENYDDLSELYDRILGQWALELNHVVSIVGGLDSQQRHVGQAGVRFTPVPRARQAQAVQFLNDRAFATPAFLVDREILRRIEPNGEVDRIRAAQQRVLANLLSAPRLARLIEMDAIDGAAAYRPVDFLTDVRKGVWKELAAPAVRVDAYRRNLQRAHVELLAGRVNTAAAANDDTRALFRGELKALQADARRAVPKAADATTRLHLQDILARIEQALDPTKAPVAAAPAGRAGADAAADDDEASGAGLDSCWPDYAIHADRGDRRDHAWK